MTLYMITDWQGLQHDIIHDYRLNGYSSKEVNIKAYFYWLFIHDGKCNKFGVYIQLRKCANNNVLRILHTRDVMNESAYIMKLNF